MSNLKLKAEERKITGRKVKRLRMEGVLPANIFGSNVKSVAIQVNQKEFGKVFTEAGETNIIEISLGKDIRPVLVHNVQHDPVADTMIHADFLQVDLKKKVTAEVPIETFGESPAEKQGLGTVVQYLNEVEVEALPAEIPNKFEIDISALADVDQMVQVKDIKVDVNKVKIETDPESIVVKVEPPKEEKEEPVVVESAEGETPESAEGEEGTEDAESPKEK